MMVGTTSMNGAGSVTRRNGRMTMRLAAVLVAASLGLAGLAGCGSSGNAETGSNGSTSTNTNTGTSKGKAGKTEERKGLDAKQTGKQELRWNGLLSGFDNTNKDEYVFMVDLDWRNTGDGDAQASQVLTGEVTTPSGKQGKVTFDYQTPSTDVADQSLFKPENPTLKVGETGRVKLYIHMPWDEVNAVPTPKNPMQLTIRDNGGNEFHWTIPVLPIQTDPVAGDGITPADPNDPDNFMPKYDWVK
ncbi:hypothetical protein Tam10B_1271 [Bifidobacterium vansinderenii]|uniref:Uncharacterized protein n=2 Tax=Bifidobacterium vansinderenii TaxID=1984871 RepID=A0A229VXR2_9BIFI|nr:hypothetical protein Tam10B_1271 [Bifidobacterium vansinderenii]